MKKIITLALASIFFLNSSAFAEMDKDEKLLNEKAYAFNLCQQVGCITSFPVDKNVLDRFKKGKNLDLEYISSTNQKIKIKFNLNGFTKAFEKISQN